MFRASAESLRFQFVRYNRALLCLRFLHNSRVFLMFQKYAHHRRLVLICRRRMFPVLIIPLRLAGRLRSSPNLRGLAGCGCCRRLLQIRLFYFRSNPALFRLLNWF